MESLTARWNRTAPAAKGAYMALAFLAGSFSLSATALLLGNLPVKEALRAAAVFAAFFSIPLTLATLVVWGERARRATTPVRVGKSPAETFFVGVLEIVGRLLLILAGLWMAVRAAKWVWLGLKWAWDHAIF